MRRTNQDNLNRNDILEQRERREIRGNNITILLSELTEAEKQKLNALQRKKELFGTRIWQEKIEKLNSSGDKEKQVKLDEYKNTYRKFSTEDVDFSDLKFSEENEDELARLLQQDQQERNKEEEKVNRELMNAPKEELFRGFDTEEQKDRKERNDEITTAITLEQARLVLDKLPPKLKAIFKQFFILELDSNNWSSDHDEAQTQAAARGGAIIEKIVGQDKFKIIVDPLCCQDIETNYFQGMRYSVYFRNPDKLLYIVARTMIALFSSSEKDKFNKACKEEVFGRKLDQNCEQGNDDWLAFCLTDKDTSKKISPKLLQVAENWLDSLDVNKINQEGSTVNLRDDSRETIKCRAYYNDEYFKRIKQEWKNLTTGQKIADMPSGGNFFARFMNIKKWLHIDPKKWELFLWYDKFKTSIFQLGLRTPIVNFFVEKVMNLAAIVKNFRADDDQYYQYLAAEDSKAISAIKSKELAEVDRAKEIKNVIFDKDASRQLILAFSDKGEYKWWRIQYWLWKHDKTFEKTKGAEVSREGFDFITRAVKLYNKAINGQGAYAPYKESGGRYIRNSYEKQLQTLDIIISSMSSRQVQNMAPNIYFDMRLDDGKGMREIYYNGLGDNEKLGGNRKEGESIIHTCEQQGDLKSFLGAAEADFFIGEMGEYAKEIHEENFNTLFSPGQVALIRRLKQAERVEPYLFNEFTSPFTIDSYDYFKTRVGEAEEPMKNLKKSFDKYMKISADKELEIASYEETSDIYRKFGKEEQFHPNMRKPQLTEHGKLLEFIKQSQNQILDVEGVSSEIRNTILTRLNKLIDQNYISSKDIFDFEEMVEGSTKGLDKAKTNKLREILDEIFEHLKRLLIAKEYQGIFKPYERKFFDYYQPNYRAKPGVNSNKIDEAKKSFLNKLEAGESYKTIINELRKEFDFLEFDEDEIKKIELEHNEQKKNDKTADLFYGKLKNAGTDGGKRFKDDYNDLLNVYQSTTRLVRNQEESQEIFNRLLLAFGNLNLIPKSEKDKTYNTIKELQTPLQIAMAVYDNHLIDKERMEKRKSMAPQFYDLEMEETKEE